MTIIGEQFEAEVHELEKEIAALKAGKDWDAFVAEYLKWADETFPYTTPESCAMHRKAEARELYEEPYDDSEAADIFFLSVHRMHKQGKSFLDVLRNKLDKNKARKWSKPNEEGWCAHVKDG